VVHIISQTVGDLVLALIDAGARVSPIQESLFPFVQAPPSILVDANNPIRFEGGPEYPTYCKGKRGWTPDPNLTQWWTEPRPYLVLSGA